MLFKYCSCFYFFFFFFYMMSAECSPHQYFLAIVKFPVSCFWVCPFLNEKRNVEKIGAGMYVDIRKLSSWKQRCESLVKPVRHKAMAYIHLSCPFP